MDRRIGHMVNTPKNATAGSTYKYGETVLADLFNSSLSFVRVLLIVGDPPRKKIKIAHPILRQIDPFSVLPRRHAFTDRSGAKKYRVDPKIVRLSAKKVVAFFLNHITVFFTVNDRICQNLFIIFDELHNLVIFYTLIIDTTAIDMLFYPTY